MLADFNRRATGSHIGVAPVRSYVLHWEEFCQDYASRWSKFHSLWVNFKGPLLLINFDHLVHSLETEVKKISRFIAHPSLHLDTSCALADARGGSKRKHVTFDKMEVFSQEQIKLLNKNIDIVQTILKKRFPEVASAMSLWKQNATGAKQKWIKPPHAII